MNLDKLVRIVVVAGSGVFALAGCAADPAVDTEPTAATADKPTAAEEENIARTESALTSGGGGGGNSFSCGALGCICYGDWDCNNMFSGSACGSWPAKCYERGPSQYCICAPWVRMTAGRATAGTGAAQSGGLLAK